MTPTENEAGPVREAATTSPKLDPAALYGLAGDFVRLADPHSEAAPAAVLVQLFSGFSNLVGPSPRFMVEATSHRARLFVVIVGASAKARKGTAWQHVRTLLRAVDPFWAADRVGGGADRDRSGGAGP